MGHEGQSPFNLTLASFLTFFHCLLQTILFFFISRSWLVEYFCVLLIILLIILLFFAIMHEIHQLEFLKKNQGQLAW